MIQSYTIQWQWSNTKCHAQFFIIQVNLIDKKHSSRCIGIAMIHHAMSVTRHVFEFTVHTNNLWNVGRPFWSEESDDYPCIQQSKCTRYSQRLVDSPADAKVCARQQCECVYEDPQRTWCAMLYRGVCMVNHGTTVLRTQWYRSTPWYSMMYHGIPRYTMVIHGVP